MSYLDEMLASLRDMAASRGSNNMPWDPTPADAGPDFKDRFGSMAPPTVTPFGPAGSFPTAQPTETYTDYSQGWPQTMTRPKAQFADMPVTAPSPPGVPQMEAQAPLAGLEGTLGANPAPFSLAGPSVPPSLAAAREMTAQPPIQPGGGLPPMAGSPPAPAVEDAGGPTGAPAPPAAPPAAPAAPAAPTALAAAPAEEPSFLQKLSSGAKGLAPALLGMGAALQGDQGHMTAALMNQQQALAEQAHTQNLTAKALLAKGVDASTVAAAVREPSLLKALVGEHFGKSKYKIQVVGEDQFGGKTYAAVNENDPTDFKTFVPGKGFIKADGGGGDAGAGGAGESGAGGYLAPGVKELDPAKAGDEYLSQFSPEAQAAVKNYLSGTSSPTSNPRKGWAQNIKSIAQKYGADMGIPADDAAFAQRKAFATSLGDTKSGVGLQAKGFQQGLEHFTKLSDNLVKMKLSNGLGLEPVAGWVNWFKSLTTDQQELVHKSDVIGAALAREMGNLFSPRGGGVHEAAEAKKAISNAYMSGKSAAGSLEAVDELMHGGLRALEERRDQLFPNGNAPKGANFLGDEQKAALEHIRKNIAILKGGASPETAPGAASGPPKPGKYIWTPDKGLVAAP